MIEYLVGLGVVAGEDDGHGEAERPHDVHDQLVQELHRRFLREGLGVTRKVDVRLPGKGNSNSHGARPVHLIITMIKWIRTSRLSIKNSLSYRRFLRFGFGG